jgi:hypothetical protein
MDLKQNRKQENKQNRQQENKNYSKSALLFQRNRKRTPFTGRLWIGPRVSVGQLVDMQKTLRLDEDTEIHRSKSYNQNPRGAPFI